MSYTTNNPAWDAYIHNITDRIADMQFDLSTQSKELSQFYRDYFEATQNVVHQTVFKPYHPDFRWLCVGGLCANLNTWLTRSGLLSDDKLCVEYELLKQFRDAALKENTTASEAYPFNHSSVDYHNDRAFATVHTNPARSLWVQKHLVYNGDQAMQYIKENV